jgi:hypothetical protein
MNEITTTGSFDLSPRSLEEAFKFADMLADSSIVPKDFIGKPGNILVAMQWGMELGLKPLQAMQNIAVINGRPSLWGDAVLALVLASPLCEYIEEWEENGTAYCKAGLLGKQGPWSQYPQRMKKMRARSFAVRDNFADVLKGIQIAEEVGDYPAERDITPARQTPTQIAQSAAEKARPALENRHGDIIRHLESVAQQYGGDALSESWSKLTKEDRKAIGAEELNRLKKLAAVDVEPQTTEQPQEELPVEREPGSDDE